MGPIERAPQIRSWNDQTLDQLRQQYEGRWELWYVPKYLGGTDWCARIAGARTGIVCEPSPEAMVAAMAVYEAAHPDQFPGIA